MPDSLKTEIEKARTAAVAATCTLTDAEIILADLADKARVIDSQIEHFHGLIARFEAIAEAWEYQVRRVADISHFDMELRKLTARILQKAVPEADKGTGGNGGKISVDYTR